MGLMDMLKNAIGNTRTSNLNQNSDLVEELGYDKKSEPTELKAEQNEKALANPSAPEVKTPPTKKTPDDAIAAVRG